MTTPDDRVNVLLVDDQPAKLLSYEAVLAELGENLIRAGSAREALDCLLKNDIAVILIDVCMPELDGFDLVTMIRQHPRFDRTAIIFVSAVFMSDVDRLRGYERGAVDYVSVPIVPEILRAKVAAFADLHRKTRQLEHLNEELERRVTERTRELEASAERLRAGEERLRLAVEGAGMGTWDADLRTGRAFGSTSYFTILGYEPVPDGSADTDMWLSRVHPEDVARVRAALDRCRQDRSLFSPDHRVVRADNGEVAWLSVFGRFLCDESGAASRFVGVLFDITQRKLAEQRVAVVHDITRALAASERLEAAAPDILRALGQHLDAAVATLWLADEEQGVLRSAHVEQATPGPGIEAFAEATRALSPARGANLPGLAWSTSRAVALRDLTDEASFQRAEQAAAAGLTSGVAFPVLSGERCLCVLEYFTRDPLPHEQSLQDMVSAIGRDIGQFVERRSLEIGLRESEERLNLAVTAGSVATWVWDLAHDRVFGDERLAFYFGIDATELSRGVPRERLQQAVDAQDRARFVALVDETLARGTEYNGEFRVHAADGGLFWLRARGRVERDPAGRAVRFPAALIDITETVRMQDALRDADRRKDQFLAMLAHELRNPLSSVRNAVKIMHVQPLEETTLHWCRDMIDRQVDHLARLVDDLLDVSRITEGKIKLRVEPVDLVTVVAEAVEASRPLISVHRPELVVELPGSPVWINGDRVRLTQVLTNLLHNAAKYQDQGGRIQLGLERAGAEAVIRVRDQGAGIPPEMLARIFELFTQVEATLDRAQGGLGIGLSLVKKLVELHGGSVQVVSEGRNRGSEFSVHLPCLAGEPGAPPVIHGAAQGPEGPGLRVLVVDDNRDAAESLAMLLRVAGHAVLLAHDGKRALELGLAESPEAVVLDIGLPGMDGLQVCRRLREHGLRDTLIVAMTGYGQAGDMRSSEEAGFDAHVVKPVDPAALMRLLRSAPRRAPAGAACLTPPPACP